MVVVSYREVYQITQCVVSAQRGLQRHVPQRFPFAQTRDAEHRHTVAPQTSSPPVISMVISVKVVTSSIVTACTFTAAATTVFAELLAMAVAERSESERAMLAIQVHVASGRWALASVGRSLTAEHRMRRARGCRGDQ